MLSNTSTQTFKFKKILQSSRVGMETLVQDNVRKSISQLNTVSIIPIKSEHMQGTVNKSKLQVFVFLQFPSKNPKFKFHI